MIESTALWASLDGWPLPCHMLTPGIEPGPQQWQGFNPALSSPGGFAPGLANVSESIQLLEKLHTLNLWGWTSLEVGFFPNPSMASLHSEELSLCLVQAS